MWDGNTSPGGRFFCNPKIFKSSQSNGWDLGVGFCCLGCDFGLINLPFDHSLKEPNKKPWLKQVFWVTWIWTGLRKSFFFFFFRTCKEIYIHPRTFQDRGCHRGMESFDTPNWKDPGRSLLFQPIFLEMASVVHHKNFVIWENSTLKIDR